MTSLDNRNSSALFKRAEQLKRWSESDTNSEPSEPKRKSQRIQFTDGCVFLAACAENRAFVRCVRNFLRINIVAQEELQGGASKFTPSKGVSNPYEPTGGKNDPHSMLSKVMKEKGISFDILKQKLVDEKFTNADDLNEVEDISKSKVFELIERIKRAK